MRRIAWGLLLLFAFAAPWEYSLDLGAGLGNVARVAGILLLLAAAPAVAQSGRVRRPGAVGWLTLALYLWFCATYLWTIDPEGTLDRMRGFFQEMMAVWLIWELADDPRDLRSLMRALVAGSWVLTGVTLASLSSPQAIAENQIRFVADGQDPNDVARFLDLSFPIAAVLAGCETGWLWRTLAWGYIPLGLAAVVLTASRGGFVAAMLALTGCALVLAGRHPRAVLMGAAGLPLLGAGLWFAIPHETLERLATIPEQLQGGDLNQRLNIWDAGRHAFAQAPVLGTGAGTFAVAAGLHPLDTAHNTELSILVGGGLVASFLALAIVTLAAKATLGLRGPLRLGLATALLVWAVAAQVDTVEENRLTWLLVGMIALAGRLGTEDPGGLARCFRGALRRDGHAMRTTPATGECDLQPGGGA
jgi:hypothetical protein